MRGEAPGEPLSQPPALVLGVGLIEWVLVAERTYRPTLLETGKQVKELDDSHGSFVHISKGIVNLVCPNDREPSLLQAKIEETTARKK